MYLNVSSSPEFRLPSQTFWFPSAKTLKPVGYGSMYLTYDALLSPSFFRITVTVICSPTLGDVVENVLSIDISGSRDSILTQILG